MLTRLCLATAQVALGAIAGLTGLYAYRRGAAGIVLVAAFAVCTCITTCVVLLGTGVERPEVER